MSSQNPAPPPSDAEFRRQFFRALMDRPLSPDDYQYVSIYSDIEELRDDDPVDRLAFAIETLDDGSAQLFSGYRGTGKSTELRRLRSRLRASGAFVSFVDYDDRAGTTDPLHISTFLLTVVGAVSDDLDAAGIGTDGGYLAKFLELAAKWRLDLSISAEKKWGPAQLKVALKNDPSFRDRLAQHMSGLLGELVEHIHTFLRQCRANARERGYERFVIIVDSVDHHRGDAKTADKIQQSLVAVFGHHADKLSFPAIHCVYTVPAYLHILAPSIMTDYNSGHFLLPALRVTNRGAQRQRNQFICQAIRAIVRKRGDYTRLLSDTQLDDIAELSGGHLRVLLTLLREITVRSSSLPATPRAIEKSITQVLSYYLPITTEDVRALGAILESQRAVIESQDRIPQFARLLDEYLVLPYRNGEEWFDVLPLLRDHVRSRMSELAVVDGGASV